MAAKRIFDYKRGVLSTTDAGTATLDIPVTTNTVIGFEARITPHVQTTHVGGIFFITGAIGNASGVVALSGAPNTLTTLSASIVAATAVFTANTTNLRLTVTGVAAIGVIEWQYEIKLIYN